jgi:hypothetical protein
MLILGKLPSQQLLPFPSKNSRFDDWQFRKVDSRRLHFSPSVPSIATGGQTASKPLSPQGFSSLTVASSMVTVLPADDGK